MAEVHGGVSRARQMVAIFLVSLAGLLLEVGYTRIVSYKLWYYYTYLVIGLALLGIGSGGILVVLSKRLRATATQRIIALCSIFGAISIVIGYLVISRIPVNTVSIWDYGTADSFANLGIVAVICFAIFASFIALGIIVATILGRAPDGIGRLYFADLIGAGLGCLAAIPLISSLGPPDVIMVSALIFTGVGLLALTAQRSAWLMGVGAVVAVGLVLIVTGVIELPDVRTEDTKAGPANAAFSEWGPVFRIDVLFVPGNAALLLHDGTFGSAMHKYNDNPKSLTSYDKDPRALPFKVLGQPPKKELIIGSAAGQRDPGVAALQVEEDRGRRAEPGHAVAADGPLQEVQRRPRPPAGREPPPGRRPHLPRPEQGEVQPRLVRRAGQLRGEQRRVIGCVRPLRELPVHEGDDRGQPAPPLRRRDDGGAVR